MKQSFLDSLKGLFLDQADALVEAEGLVSYSLPTGSVMIAIARPETVILWMNDHNQVESAEAGDPLEVEDDT